MFRVRIASLSPTRQCIATSASAVARNRVNRRGKLTEDIAADLASAGTPVAATRIGNRVALAQAMALGFGVIENARMTPAVAEISALAEEIRRDLGLNPRLKL
jgi:chromosome partitioning protein